MRPRNHLFIKGQWRHITRFFPDLFTPKNHPCALKTHRNVFYSSRRTRWTLKFCSSCIRSKVISDHVFSSTFGTWPDLGQGLIQDLKLMYQSLRLEASYTLVFFFREALIQSGAKRHGGRTNPLLCRGRMRNGLCRRGLICPHISAQVHILEQIKTVSYGSNSFFVDNSSHRKEDNPEQLSCQGCRSVSLWWRAPFTNISDWWRILHQSWARAWTWPLRLPITQRRHLIRMRSIKLKWIEVPHMQK